MKASIKRIDVLAAAKVGLVFSPILYTVGSFIIPLGGFGIGLGAYLSGVITSALYGAVIGGVGAFVYNRLSPRFGRLKIELEVYESQRKP